MYLQISIFVIIYKKLYIKIDASNNKACLIMQNFIYSMAIFFTAYIIVTVIGILHTIFNIYILKMEAMSSKGMGSGYEKTKPFHPIYNIIIFSIFGYLYILKTDNINLKEALITGALWSIICIVFDVFAWVLIKHPWSLSFKEFYINYQPWLTLIYLSIFSGPVLGYFFTLI